MAYVAGILALAFLWLVVGLSSGFRPSQLVMGADGHPSTSKFQLLLWTGAALFGYAAIEAVRIHLHDFGPMATVPTNVLIAMGISGGTAVTAKAIRTNSEANAGTPPAAAAAAVVAAAVAAPAAGPGAAPGGVAVVEAVAVKGLKADLSGILQGTDGKPDLGKLQIVVWTGFALVIFLARVLHTVHTGGVNLPDIDQTQMVLMGIGHGTYLGKKIVES